MQLRRVLLGLLALPIVSAVAQTAVTVPPPGNPPWIADRPGLAVERAMEPAPAIRPLVEVDVMPPGPPIAVVVLTGGLQPPPRADDRAAAYRSLHEANLRAAAAAQAHDAGHAVERVALDRGDRAPAVGLPLSPWGWTWGLDWHWGYGPGLSVWWPGLSLHVHGVRGRR